MTMRTPVLIAAAIGLLSSACSAESLVLQAKPEHVVNFEPPFPFNAGELWGKLAQVTALHGENLTQDKIEAIFGVKLKLQPGHPVGSKIPIYSTTAYKDWYYDIDFLDSPQKQFDFIWGQIPGSQYEAFPLPKGEICIASNVVHETLLMQGWKYYYRSTIRGGPVTDFYGIDKYTVKSTFTNSAECLISLTIGPS